MKLDVSYRNINKESHKSTRDKIKEIVERHLAPHLESFNVSQLRLHATVEKQKLDYQITLRLHVPPKKILVAKESNENINMAIMDAVAELARQAERHHAHVSGREQWKRKQRRQRMRNMEAEVPTVLPSDKEKEALQSVTPLLPRIERYIRHELAFLRANGDLLPNYPTLADIRDEALIQLKIRWSDLDSKDEALYQELLKIVHQIIEKEVEQTRLHARDESIEARVEKDAMDEAEEMVQEEINEFYQPFEVQHVEDLLPDDSVPLPEELVESNAREASYQIMSHMPSNWRRVMMLVYQEQLPIDSIAQNILSFSIAEAEQLLQQAESFMLDSLTERGVPNVNKETLLKLLAP